MTAVCHSAIICKEQGRGKWRERGFDLSLLGLSQVKSAVLHLSLSSPVVETPLRVDVTVLKLRARLLQKYLCDEQKELQALYALQALVVTLEQPASKSQAAGMGGAKGLPDRRGWSWKVLNLRKVGKEQNDPTQCMFPCLQLE